MRSLEEIYVKTKEKGYPILIGDHLHSQETSYPKGEKRKILILSDNNVYPLYGERVKKKLQAMSWEVYTHRILPGEASKSLEMAASIYTILIDLNFERTSHLLALGGGVVGDLTGFISSTFLRGIPFFQYPTTLLAMVDSSVGGKVGVNHPKGKNLIGSFYQPEQVVIDTSTLKTLSQRELLSGLAETIKYSMIWDNSFFSYLQDSIDSLLSLHQNSLIKAIRECLKIKAEVVSIDEREQSLRAILNYGHTFGHALEAASSYQTYTHGEAVSIGISFALELALHLGLIEDHFAKEQRSLLQRAGLPTQVKGFTPQEILHHIYQDKKRERGVLRFILPVKTGKVNIHPVEERILHLALTTFLKEGAN